MVLASLQLSTNIKIGEGRVEEGWIVNGTLSAMLQIFEVSKIQLLYQL